VSSLPEKEPIGRDPAPPSEGQDLSSPIPGQTVAAPGLSSSVVLQLSALDLSSLIVLEIAALVGEPLSLRRLIEIGRPLTGGHQFTPARLGPIVTGLVGQGLLVETGDDIVCASHLAEHVAVGAMRSGRAKEAAAQIRKLQPWTGRMQRDPNALFGRFRVELYAQEASQAQGLASDLEVHFGRRAWCEVGQRFLDAESFLAFPPALALTLSRETLKQSLNRPFAAPHALRAFGQLVQQPGTDSKDQQLYGHALLMSGQRKAFEDFLAGHDFPTLEGCRRILDGDLAGLDDFQRGLRESKFFPSYTALFLYLVGLLAQEGLDSPLVAKEIAKFEAFRAPLQWMLAVKSGQLNELTDDIRRRLRDAPEAVIPHLSLILHWAGFRNEELKMEQRAAQYAAAGYPVFAEWLSWAAGGDVHQGATPPPLIGLLQADEHWRKVLQGLNAWSAPSRASAEDGGERIVWHVQPFTSPRAVEPRVQKLSKRGVWSAGRLVDLGEIWGQPPGCADAFDNRVFDALQRLDRARYRCSRSDLEDAALLALAGHPRVYLQSDPENAVELTVEPLAVRVRRFPSHLEISLDPEPLWQPTVLAQPGGPGKVRLFNLTERHVRLGRMIDSSLKIPLEGEAELREALAGLTTAGLALHSDIELAGEAQEVPADATLLVRLSPYGEGLAVQVRVAPLGQGGPLFTPGQGAPVVAGRLQGRSVQARRDLALESSSWADLKARHPDLVATDFSLLSPLESLTFLEGFVDLADSRFRLEWPEGEKFAVAMRLGLPQLGHRVRSRGEWFSLGADVRVDEDLVLSLTDLLDRRQRACGRFVPLTDGRFLALTHEVERYLERLQLLAQRHSGSEVQLLPLSALLVLEGQQVQGDQDWTNLRERVRASQQLQPAMPATLMAQLRDYQTEGVRWLLRLAHWGGVGACLADDMGLGKTVQLLAVLLARAQEGPALVVAPTSVCWNWAEEAARFAPALRICSVAELVTGLAPVHRESDGVKTGAPRVEGESDGVKTGSPKVEGESEGVKTGAPTVEGESDRLGPGDVLVTSYGLLVNHLERLQGIQWATLILDEAQAIKNAGTQRSQAAHSLRAGFRVAATGTPVENHPEEMWALFRFLNPGLLGSRKGFGSRFATAGGQQELSRLVRPFILRRTKGQVLKELPPRTEILEKVELSPPERALYESMRRQALDSLSDQGDYLTVLAHLTRLRRLCCHPRLVDPEANLASAKLERCLELVEELIDGGHRALIFSQFVSYLGILRPLLEDRGIAYAYLDGSTPPKERRKAVQDFQQGQGDLFLISLKAGGTGLNLTGADYVIHLDPWWNPAVEDQASDRAHRMGQQRPVTVYRLVAQATIEEQIVDLHSQKRDLAQRLLEGTETTARLSASDLLTLLQG
jgi:superfamily II DNA or RNA helicase